MCDPEKSAEDRWQASKSTPTATTPEAKLAELMNRDLGTFVASREVRMFVLANWKQVCKHAHAIHDDAA